MCAYPACTAASSSASISGHIERLSDTVSGPPTPWNSLSPRSLSSDALEVGEHLVVRPPGAARRRPLVEVGAMAAEVDHGVDRARASDHAPARQVQAAAAEARLALAEQVPVETGLEDQREHGRNVQLGRRVLSARLEQQHLDLRILTESRGEHAPRRPGADDHVISRHRALLRSGSWAELSATPFRYQDCCPYRGAGVRLSPVGASPELIGLYWTTSGPVEVHSAASGASSTCATAANRPRASVSPASGSGTPTSSTCSRRARLREVKQIFDDNGLA